MKRKPISDVDGDCEVLTLNVGTHLPRVGERFTIEGFGISARGHLVKAGRSVKTGRRMKAKKLHVFVVKAGI